MRFWPLGVVGLAWYLVCGPLLGAGDQVFGLLAGDGIRAAWFQDFVSRNVFSWGGLGVLSDFDWPSPRARYEELSTVADSVFVAPLGWVLGWPRQWGVAQALAILVNGLGLAWLVRVVGCRGLGFSVAGCLGICILQVLKELHMGRINAAWIGLAAAALAAWLWVFSEGPLDRKTLVQRVALAAGLGGFAAAVYPPWLLLMVPVGLVLAVEPFRRADLEARVAAVLAVVVGFVLALPQLRATLRSPRAQLDLSAPSVTQGIGSHLGGELHVDMAVSASSWLSLGPPPRGAGVQPGVVLGTWLLVVLLLPFVAKRGRIVLLVVWAAVMAALSMGPHSPVAGVLSEGTWNSLGVIHDFGRFATVAGAITAVAAGMALDDAWKSGRRRVRQLVLGMSVLAVVQAVAASVGTLRDPQRWTHVPELPGTTYLQTASAKPTVELPYGERLAFLSVLAAPESPRVNPINLDRPDPRQSEVIRWFGRLGVGEIPQASPGAAVIRSAGIGRVLLDRNRCGRPYANESPRVYPWPGEVPVRACGEGVQRALVTVLGPPEEVEEGVFVWEIGEAAP